MTEREMIEAACAAQGLTIQGWAEEDDRPLAKLGRWRVTEEGEDESAGIYADAEGELQATVVGAEQYANLRVHFGFLEDDTEGANEIRDLLSLEPVES